VSFALQPEPQILEWCLPVVYDCLSEFYGDQLPSAPDARMAMIERHFGLWASLIQGDFHHLRTDFDLLAAQARSLGLDFPACWAADRDIAAEILDISLRRFRRMPRDAHANNAALLALLMRLQIEEAGYSARRPGSAKATNGATKTPRTMAA
jgi:hypothetical protein